MNKEILKKKAKGIVKREATKSRFTEEHREKTLKKIKEKIENGEIKRFQDLKNETKKELKDIAEEEDIEYYQE